MKYQVSFSTSYDPLNNSNCQWKNADVHQYAETGVGMCNVYDSLYHAN